MIVTTPELIAIVYAMRNKPIGTSEGYKSKPSGLLWLLHQTLKAKAKTAKIGKHNYDFIFFECSKYLETLKRIDNFRMNKPTLDDTIKLIKSVTDKIEIYDNKRSS